MTNTSSAFKDSKPHYNILDGLRGVAAIMVLWYHVFEAFATSDIDQVINHGYLAVVTLLLGGGLAYFAISGEGYLGVGWTMNTENMIGGSLRFLFSFLAGLLLSRIFKPMKIKGAFWIGLLIIVALTAMPRVGGEETRWMNGIYDSLCVLVIFPLVVYIGASERSTSKLTTRICKFLGDISYPLYMVHYPFIYLYYAYVKNNNLTFADSLTEALLLVFGSILLAYVCLKLYDEPLRKFLARISITDKYNKTKKPLQ